MIKVQLSKSTSECSDKVPLGYKDKIEVLQKDKDNMAKKVGELTLERDFAVDEVPLEGKSSQFRDELFRLN